MNTADVLNELGVEFIEGGTHKSVRQNFVGIRECPWCGHGDYYAAFARDGRAFSCWACGSHGFLQTLRRITGKPADVIFAASRGLDFGPGRDESRTGKYLPPDSVYLTASAAHLKYLAGCGIDVRQAEELWKVSAVGHLGRKYAWRLLFPVFKDGRAVSWTTRAIGKGGWLSAPPERESVPIKDQVYGLDLVRGTCVVVENPRDAVRLGPGAVSTFGAGFTRRQLCKLAKVPRRVVCFDAAGDATGERQGERLAAALAPHDGETEIVTLDCKDVGEASDREVKRLRRLYLDP